MDRPGSKLIILNDGIRVGRKRVEQLMEVTGSRCAGKRKHATTIVRDKRHHPSAELVDRNFYADRPNVL